MNKNYIVIENRETEEQFLLHFSKFNKNGIPKGYAKRTGTIPLQDWYWETVKDLPVFNFSIN